MDDDMCRDMMQILSFAPLVFIFNGYWLFDNKLVFNHIWSYKMRIIDNVWSQHLINPTINQAAPMLYIGVAAIIIMIMKGLIRGKLAELMYDEFYSDNVLEVDEDLPSFFEAMLVKDARWVTSEQKHL